MKRRCLPAHAVPDRSQRQQSTRLVGVVAFCLIESLQGRPGEVSLTNPSRPNLLKDMHPVT